MRFLANSSKLVNFAKEILREYEKLAFFPVFHMLSKDSRLFLFFGCFFSIFIQNSRKSTPIL